MSVSPFIKTYMERLGESLRDHEEQRLVDTIENLTKASKKDNIQVWKNYIKENSNNGNNSSRELNEQDSRTL